MSKILVALLLMVPMAANADLIRFDWTNNGTAGALQSGSGYWIIDENDLTPGFGNYSAQVVEFAFEWTTTNNSFMSSSANGDQPADVFLNFSSTLQLTGFDVCFSTDGVCAAATSRPLIRVRGIQWGATGGDNDPNNSTNNANFVNAPQTVTTSTVDVPEPGALALLGLGLLGVAAGRRRRKA